MPSVAEHTQIGARAAMSTEWPPNDFALAFGRSVDSALQTDRPLFQKIKQGSFVYV